MFVTRHARSAASVLVLLGLSSRARAAEPFTLIVVPDTQNYADFDGTNNQYNLGQMRWIRDNMQTQNIKFVMHLGDHQNPGNPYHAKTAPNNIYEPDFTRPIGNAAAVQDKLECWERADDAIDFLDANNIPYSLVPGNHDYLDHDTKDEPIYYLQHFGPQRYAGKPTFGGSSPADATNKWAGMNTYHRFEAGGYTFLNLAMQFDPDVNDLRWAQKIINQNPGLPTIVTTHAHLDGNGYQPGYKPLFDDLVRLNPQVIMTLNGHITAEYKHTVKNIANQDVHQMLVDYQSQQFDTQFGGDWYKGGGFLRTMQFDTDANLVRVKSYSPIIKANLTDGDSQFNLALNLTQRFGLPDGAGITRSVSFRQGVNGYASGADTFLEQAAPDAVNGAETTGWVDGDRSGGDAQGLIRFSNLFGAGGIPAGAMIESAELVLHTTDATDSQSPNQISLYRMLNGWTENGTWNTKVSGISADAVEAILGANDSVAPTLRDGFVTFDVTESLYAWAAGAPNEGWVLMPGGNNGWQWDTSEAADLLDRPELLVTYRIVPEPASLGVLALGAMMVLARRRARGV